MNALKDGLFAKAILLKGESRAAYDGLLNGLMEDLQPHGKLETVLVENLAILLWRNRRLFQAENAEVSAKIAFAEIDYKANQHFEALAFSRAAIASGGLLMRGDNPIIVSEARELLRLLRMNLTTFGFKENSRILRKLYGEDADGGNPRGLRWLYECYATVSTGAKKECGEEAEAAEAERKVVMLHLIDDEIEHLTELQKMLEAADQEKIQYRLSAAVIPGPQASDRLLRLEVHLSREIDRILNWLERLQRTRKGQPLPPQVDVSIS
jgi:hypothetical protein